MGHRLFAVDIFACFHRIHSDFGVPVVGRGDANCVNAFVIKDLAVVADWLCTSPLCSGIQTLLPDIANGNDVNWLTFLVQREKSVDVGVSHPAATHNGDTDSLISAKHRLAQNRHRSQSRRLLQNSRLV